MNEIYVITEDVILTNEYTSEEFTETRVKHDFGAFSEFEIALDFAVKQSKRDMHEYHVFTMKINN